MFKVLHQVQQRNKRALQAWREAKPWLRPAVHLLAGLLCLVGLLASSAALRRKPTQTWRGLGLQFVFCVAALYGAALVIGTLGQAAWGLLNAVPGYAWALCALTGVVVWLMYLGEEALN